MHNDPVWAMIPVSLLEGSVHDLYRVKKRLAQPVRLIHIFAHFYAASTEMLYINKVIRLCKNTRRTSNDPQQIGSFTISSVTVDGAEQKEKKVFT